MHLDEDGSMGQLTSPGRHMFAPKKFDRKSLPKRLERHRLRTLEAQGLPKPTPETSGWTLFQEHPP